MCQRDRATLVSINRVLSLAPVNVCRLLVRLKRCKHIGGLRVFGDWLYVSHTHLLVSHLFRLDLSVVVKHRTRNTHTHIYTTPNDMATSMTDRLMHASCTLSPPSSRRSLSHSSHNMFGAHTPTSPCVYSHVRASTQSSSNPHSFYELFPTYTHTHTRVKPHIPTFHRKVSVFASVTFVAAWLAYPVRALPGWMRLFPRRDEERKSERARGTLSSLSAKR